MTKYIIENCPCYINDYWNFEACKNGSTVNGTYITRCNSVDDCLLKQIVEKCNGVFDKRAIRINRFDILNLLEIEEVE